MNQDLSQISDDKLDVILRRSENVNIEGSLHQKARIEREIRDRKTRSTPVTIGILNTGKNNQFHDNSFDSLDIGIKDEGEGTRATGNRFSSRKSSNTPWFQTGWGMLLITVIGGVIVAMVSHYFGLV